MIEGYFYDGMTKGFGRWMWDDSTIYKGFIMGLRCEGWGEVRLGEYYKDIMLEGWFKSQELVRG
jgi:hypothetical protein